MAIPLSHLLFPDVCLSPLLFAPAFRMLILLLSLHRLMNTSLVPFLACKSTYLVWTHLKGSHHTGSHRPLIIPLPTLLVLGLMFLSPWCPQQHLGLLLYVSGAGFRMEA